MLTRSHNPHANRKFQLLSTHAAGTEALDIIFFAVVADIEILKAKICIGNDFTGVGLCNRSHFLKPPLLFYLNFGDEPIVGKIIAGDPIEQVGIWVVRVVVAMEDGEWFIVNHGVILVECKECAGFFLGIVGGD